MIAAAVLAVLALGVGAFVVFGGGDDGEQASGEVFLVAADDPGPDPFTTDAKVATPETTAPPSTTTASTTTGATRVVTVRAGGTPGLYGGTRDAGRCDTAQLVSFLAANRAKAQAWVGALNSDPSLRWSGGTSVGVSEIAAYVDELTPVTLVADTRVTNHGYANGRATSIPAVLQAGTAVLVDQYGVPRVKCGCGNPLTAPAAIRGTVRYTGTPWSGWNPASVTVVSQSTTVVETFVLVNLSGPGYLGRPSGTDGADDTEAKPPSTTTTTASPTTSAPSTTKAPGTTAPAGDFCEIATGWVPKLRAFVLTGLGTDTFPDTTELIAGVDAMLPLSPSPEVTSDLKQLRGFLEAPSADAASIELSSLRKALIDGCGINLDG